MPKTCSSREIRSTRRELLRAHSTIRKNAQKAEVVTKRASEKIEKAKRYIVHFRSKTMLLNKDLQSLRSRVLAQQTFIQKQQRDMQKQQRDVQKQQKAMALAKKTYKHHDEQAKRVIGHLKITKNLMNKDLRELHSKFLAAQTLIRNQQTLLKEPMDVARTMVALSNEVCSHCLGTRHVLKTKRNVRYSAECKKCKK